MVSASEAARHRSRPVLERTSRPCRPGWIGKNTLLLRPQLGCLVLHRRPLDHGRARFHDPLSTAAVAVAPVSTLPDPAFVAPYVLDAAGAASPTSPSRPIAARSTRVEGEAVPMAFGCDICRTSVRGTGKRLPRASPRSASTPYPGAERILEMSDEELRIRFRQLPLSRAKPAGLRRNATIARAKAAGAPRGTR